MTAWRDYQEQVAQFFRDLGLAAETDVTVHGPRTSHDVDVLVRFDHVGFEVTWIVECKHWQAPVSKLHILALRTIVSESGADRGILMAERGFQRGAVEAAELTNVRLTSLAELSQTAGHAIGLAQLRALQERVDACKARYWALPKDHRIAHGLRPDVAAPGYSGTAVMEAVQSGLNGAFRGQFPVKYDDLVMAVHPEYCPPGDSPEELAKGLQRLMDELEARLDAAEAASGQS
jgi:restriction system protein